MEDLHKLENKWSLWFHKINDHNYNLDSYINIHDIEYIEYLIVLYRKLNNFSAGMFFLMKENIKPMWEDEKNLNGGFWSFKILKKNINQVWYKLSLAIINNSVFKNIETNNFVNGISLSPKINNCIIKIWFSKKYNDINIFDIDFLNKQLDNSMNFEEARFITHKK